MKKVLYVATVVKTHIMEFHIPYLKMLKGMGWETAVAARNDYENASDCNIPYCDKYFNVPFERNPLKAGNIKAYHVLKKIIDEGDYDIIHCHTPVGAMLTRIAASGARKRKSKVIYTAHGFHFYNGAPAINWLLYYPVERILAHKTDVLITICNEDYERAKKFKAKKIVYTPGIGIDTKKFGAFNEVGRDTIRNELKIDRDTTILLSVGEINNNKNHVIMIKALEQIQNVIYIICGVGVLEERLKTLAKESGVIDRVHFMGYRKDVKDFYSAADIFVFPSFREGLPVALMEAMASGLVCVSAKNRGSNELMEGSRLLFDPNNMNELIEKINVCLTENCSKEIERNKQKVTDYDLSNTLNIVKNVYLDAMK